MQANNALLRTNDQYLSLTDQMNLGVRSVELDTHWFEVWPALAPVPTLLQYLSCGSRPSHA